MADTTKITAKQRHEEIRFEKMVTSHLEHKITVPDLWKTRIRVLARGQGKTVDISGMVDNLSWQDESSDDLANINTQAAMTGSITMHKPPLRQYNRLAPLLYPGESVTARIVRWGKEERSSFGALGIVIICQVGYGNKYTNLWAMRVSPGYDSGTAETVTLADGSWAMNLTDDLWTLAQTVADFKYTAGKKVRKNGWRCDQIAHDVCQRYRVPVRTLSQGTAYFSLSASATRLTSPIHVITAAYQEETKRTGRTFIIRWGAPDKKHLLGALEVIPMRRNRVLYQFREQLLDATLTRSQDPGFATVIEARGTIKAKGKKGKAHKVTTVTQSKAAIKRFGFIRKTVDFGTVSSELELQIIAKRALAQRLTPIRTAELNHPGIATIRRGDAIHINLPEEGYGNVALTSLATPGTKHRSKAYVAALKEAEDLDPTMFGQPDPELAGQAASQAGGSGADEAKPGANQPAFTPIANQGIAFVTSAVHSVAAGSYTMDLTTGFIDVLDPQEVRAQVDKTIRDFKSGGKKGKASDTGWTTVGATWFSDAQGAYGSLTDGGTYYAELGQAGANAHYGGLLGKALGQGGPLSPGTKLEVQYKGKTVTATKRDIGSGQLGQPHYAIDLHTELKNALGWSPNDDVQVRLA
jgi:hypothetical protein